MPCDFDVLSRTIKGLLQGRRRFFESGTAIEDRRCSSSADGTRGERTRGGLTSSRKGGLGEHPKKIL